MAERIKDSKKDQDSDLESLNTISDKQQEKIRERLEKSDRRETRTSKEQALAEARELAKEADDDNATKENARSAENLRRAPSKKQRGDSFRSQMKELQNEMNPTGRIVSKFIHNSAVERISDIASSTLARPNALLSGSIVAFLFITVLYFIARYYGYHLSGFETLFAFVLGWIVGILSDYFRAILGSRDK